MKPVVLASLHLCSADGLDDGLTRRAARDALGLVAAAVLVVPLGACSDPPAAGKIPSATSPTATATPSTPTPIPTTSPASPTPSTPEAEVDAAVRTYYAELNRAAQTNDTTRLKTMIDISCDCYRAIKVIDENARQRYTTPSAKWNLRRVLPHAVKQSAALVEVKYDLSAYDVVGADGKVVGHVKSQSNHWDLSLIRRGSGWVVNDVSDLGS